MVGREVLPGGGRACFVFRNGGLGVELLQAFTGSCDESESSLQFLGREKPNAAAFVPPYTPNQGTSGSKGDVGSSKVRCRGFYGPVMRQRMVS